MVRNETECQTILAPEIWAEGDLNLRGVAIALRDAIDDNDLYDHRWASRDLDVALWGGVSDCRLFGLILDAENCLWGHCPEDYTVQWRLGRDGWVGIVPDLSPVSLTATREQEERTKEEIMDEIIEAVEAIEAIRARVFRAAWKMEKAGMDKIDIENVRRMSGTLTRILAKHEEAYALASGTFQDSLSQSETVPDSPGQSGTMPTLPNLT